MAEAKLVAKVETQGARKAKDDLKKFSDQADKSEKGVNKLGGALKAAPKLFAAIGAAAGASALLIARMAKQSAEARFQLQALSDVAGESVSDFEALAFATNTVGISAEKLSDISKDTNEKLGEFIATGGGGFKDFFEEVAPLVNVTAKELQGLSGPQVLQQVKNAMDEANISMEEQSFFLESIASDTTLLIPLLAEEGKQLNNLTNRFNDATAAMQLTANQEKSLSDLATTFNLLDEQSGLAAASISATLAPTLDGFFNSLISVVPEATQTVIDFFNSFIDPKNKSSINAVNKEIAKSEELIEKYKERLGQLGDGFFDFLTETNVEDHLKAEQRKLTELKTQLKALEESKRKIEDAARPSGGTIAGGKTGETVDTDENKRLKQAEAQAQAFLAQTDLLGRSQLELIEIQERERLEKLREFGNQGLIEYADFENAKTRILEDAANQRDDIITQNNQLLLSSSEELFGSLADVAMTFEGEQSSIYKGLFAASKAFSIAQSIISIQTGIAKAQELGFPANLGAIANVVSTSAGVISTIRNTNLSARQQGGQFNRGQDLLVGEKGPELVRFNDGGRIADANQTASMGNGGNVTIINQTTGQIDETQTQRDDNGDLIVTIIEVLNRQVLSPNSEFNSNFDRTRNAARRF